MRPNPSFELTRYGRPVWPGRSGQLKSNYKGFPTFASNTSPWIDRAAINPGIESRVRSKFPR